MARSIPYPELTRRYVDLKNSNSARRLECAEAATVREYAELVCQSVAAFETFDVGPNEPFYPDGPNRDSEKNPKQARRTFGWAMALKNMAAPIAVDGDRSLDFSYALREVAPVHTKPMGTFESSDGHKNSTDLILRNAATGRPIVAELKIAGDKEPFTALVQALAAAAQLVPGQQRARLSTIPDAGLASYSEQPVIDVYVLLADFPTANRDRWHQLAYARGIAAGLESHPDVRRYFGRIVFLQLFRDSRDHIAGTTTLPEPALS